MGYANSLNTGSSTSGYVAQSTGTSSPLNFVVPTGVGGLILLNSQSISNQSDVEFKSVISPTYNAYRVEVGGCYPATSGVILYLQFSTNNGSSWDTGSTSYSYFVVWNNSNLIGSTGSTGIEMTFSQGNSSATPAGFVIDIINPSVTQTLCTWQGSYNETVTGRVDVYGGAEYTVASAVNAFRLIMSSGNIYGNFKVYGYVA